MNHKALILIILFIAVLIESVHADDFPMAKLPSFGHNFDLTSRF
jgi:hypothetical protein